VEPPPLETSPPERIDETLSEPDSGSHELGSDFWNDLGFAPSTNPRDRANPAEVTTEAVIASDSALSLSAELIDLATFVADLRDVALSFVPTTVPPSAAPEHDSASEATVASSVQAEPSADPALLDVRGADASESAVPSTEAEEPASDTRHATEDLSNGSGSAETARSGPHRPSEAAVVTKPRPAAPHPATPSPELLHMLAAIRRDLQIMRAADGGPHGPTPSPSTQGVEAKSGAEHKHGAVGTRASQKEAPLSKRAAKAAAKTKKKRNKRKTVVEPPHEDSDFLDPEQCGFAALIAKLQEVYDPSDTAGAAD
jgi:hypothetical protein